MDLYPTCPRCGCPRHPGLGCGCKGGVASTFGKWPGNETDAEIAAALRNDSPSGFLDMQNTLLAISDPDDYETGGEKTAETCRRLARECVESNRL